MPAYIHNIYMIPYQPQDGGVRFRVTRHLGEERLKNRGNRVVASAQPSSALPPLAQSVLALRNPRETPCMLVPFIRAAWYCVVLCCVHVAWASHYVHDVVKFYLSFKLPTVRWIKRVFIFLNVESTHNIPCNSEPSFYKVNLILASLN